MIAPAFLALAVLGAPAARADDVFLCAPGTIENDSTPDSYFRSRGCVEVEAAGFGAHGLTAPGGPPGAPDVDIGPLVFTMSFDHNAPLLGLKALTGEIVPDLTLQLRKSGSTTTTDEPYLVVAFDDARLGELVATSTGDDVPRVRGVVRWTGLTWTQRPIDLAGGLGAPQSFSWPSAP